MPVSNYVRGRAFEYRVRDDLRKRGYVVIRSAQSKGSADLVAIRQSTSDPSMSHWILLVQCKLSTGAVAPKEWNALYGLAGQAGAVPVLAVAGGPGNPKKYYILTSEKDGKGGRQPLREFEP